MTEATDLYTLTPRGTANPRRVVCYSGPDRKTYVGMSKNERGRLEIVGEASEVCSVKLDFSGFLDVDEVIESAVISGADLQTYGTQSLIFTTADHNEPREILVQVRFSSGERFADRFIARAHRLGCEMPAGRLALIRGAV